MTYTANVPTYGGAREFGRVNRGYRGLGQVETFWVQGVASYKSGASETYRRLIDDASMEACQGDPNPDVICVETRPKVDSAGNPIPWALRYIDELRTDQRADGSAGWEMYIPDLIPTTGGFLPGFLLFSGDVSQLVQGATQWVGGVYTGTRPNNLCVNCGWAFQLSQVLAPGATPGEDTGTGAVDQDSEEMERIRLERIAQLEGEEAAERARLQLEIQREAERAREEAEAAAAYAAAHPTDADAAEEAARREAEADAAAQRSQEAYSTSTARNGNGEAPPAGEAPISRAGISSGALAALAAVALLFLPIGKKGRKGGGGGGFA